MTESQKLKLRLREYLQGIDSENFQSGYSKAIDLLLEFKEKLRKEEVLVALGELDDEFEMNQYQEDIFLEINSRLEGYSSESNKIDWD